MSVSSYSKTGTKKDTGANLPKEVFDLELNHDLLSLAYRAYLASGRAVSATTLTRGMVRGGGKKPWRQKGTGRARAGSIRIPHWRGGGVTFGPSGNENYEINLPIKMKRVAIRQALSAQAADKKIITLEAFDSSDGKIKSTVELLGKLKLEGTILLVLAEKTAMIDRATRNVAGLKTVSAKYLNVFDILNADTIIITDQAIPVIEAWLSDKPAKKPIAEKVEVGDE